MSLTEILRQRLAVPSNEALPAPVTIADAMINLLVLEAAVHPCRLDAIRLIFERVDGPAGVVDLEAAVATLKPRRADSPVEAMMHGIHFEGGGPPLFDDATLLRMHGAFIPSGIHYPPPSEPKAMSEAQAREILASCVEP